MEQMFNTSHEGTKKSDKPLQQTGGPQSKDAKSAHYFQLSQSEQQLLHKEQEGKDAESEVRILQDGKKRMLLESLEGPYGHAGISDKDNLNQPPFGEETIVKRQKFTEDALNTFQKGMTEPLQIEKQNKQQYQQKEDLMVLDSTTSETS